MKNKQRESKKLMVSIMFFAIVAFAVSSCSKTSDTFSSENTQTAGNESSQESSTDEIDDMANSALSTSVSAGGRAEALTDDRLTCDGTSVTPATTNPKDNTSGTVTITFGPNGCKDSKGNVRKGKITITWTGGKWFNKGSSHTITLADYSVNGVAISGTRTVTTTDFTGTAASFTLTSSITANHTITWSDKTSATRTVDKTRTWTHSSTDDTITEDNGSGASATAYGTNRHGKPYTMLIITPLKYVGSCIKTSKVFIPTSGSKVITDSTDPAKPKVLTIDFGTGTCDNTFTVTFNGASKTLTPDGQ